MTRDALTADQRAGAVPFLGPDRSWGLGLSVGVPGGRFGWDGGFGTCWRSDLGDDLAAILLTQRIWESPSLPQVCRDFWTVVG